MCYVYLNVVVFHLYYGVKIILEYPKYITHLIILLFFIFYSIIETNKKKKLSTNRRQLST